LAYCEGLVHCNHVPGLILEHAWVTDGENHYDITLNPIPKIICHKEYTRDDVLKNIRRNGGFYPIDMGLFNNMQIANNQQRRIV
jgi:hypothetical protein